MPCLDEGFLLDTVCGRISPAQRVTLLVHIAACADCRELVFAIFRAAALAPEELPSDARSGGRGDRGSDE